jgi:DNA modification methylase
MTPYYSDDLVTLYHGDCREVTAWLEADVLVTDPPYGRGWKQGGGLKSRGRNSTSRARPSIANDSDTVARDEALALWQGLAAVFGDLTLPPPAGVQITTAYRKPVDAGTRGAVAGFRRDLEAVYLLGGWPAGIGGRTSILKTAARCVGSPEGLAARYGHPHAKPLDVLFELIDLAPGVIADPFAGSGSTLVAAKCSGRRAIGVELEERYCEIAAKRLSQDTLFGGVA